VPESWLLCRSLSLIECVSGARSFNDTRRWIGEGESAQAGERGPTYKVCKFTRNPIDVGKVPLKAFEPRSLCVCVYVWYGSKHWRVRAMRWRRYKGARDVQARQAAEEADGRWDGSFEIIAAQRAGTT